MRIKIFRFQSDSFLIEQDINNFCAKHLVRDIKFVTQSDDSRLTVVVIYEKQNERNDIQNKK